MNKILLMAFVLSFPLLVNAQNRVGDIGLEAYEAGDYVIAEDMLKKAISYEYTQSAGDQDEYWHYGNSEARAWKLTKKYRDALANLYWETGQDHKLLDYADEFQSADARQYWWCRILERRGHNEYAKNCWAGEKYDNRMKRNIRTQILLDSLTPDGTVFGYRPLPEDY